MTTTQSKRQTAALLAVWLFIAALLMGSSCSKHPHQSSLALNSWPRTPFSGQQASALSGLSPLVFASAAVTDVVFGSPPGNTLTMTGVTYAGGVAVKDMAAGGTLIFDGGSISGQIALSTGSFVGSTVIFQQVTITTGTSFTDAMFYSDVSLAGATVLFDRCTITLQNPTGSIHTSVFKISTGSADGLLFEVRETSITGRFPTAYGSVILVETTHNAASVLITKNSPLSLDNERGASRRVDIITVKGGPNAGAVYAIDDSTVSMQCRESSHSDCETDGIRFEHATLGDFTARIARSVVTSRVTGNWLVSITRDTSLSMTAAITDSEFHSVSGTMMPLDIFGGAAMLSVAVSRTLFDMDSTTFNNAVASVTGTSPTAGRGRFDFTDVIATFTGVDGGRRFMSFRGGGVDVTVTRCTVTQVARGFAIDTGGVADVSVTVQDSSIDVFGKPTSNPYSAFESTLSADNVRFNATNTTLSFRGTTGAKLAVFGFRQCTNCALIAQDCAVRFRNTNVAPAAAQTWLDITGTRIILIGTVFRFDYGSGVLIRQTGSGLLGAPSKIDIGCPNSEKPTTVGTGPVILDDHVPLRLHSYARCPPLDQDGLPTRPVRQHWLKTIIGTAGQGSTNGRSNVARIDTPSGLAYDSLRDEIYVAQRNTATIRLVNVLTWEISTYAGSGTSVTSITNGARIGAATFGNPGHMVYDTHYKRLIISDDKTHHVRGIDTASGIVSTIAGSGAVGSADGVVGVGHMDTPAGVALSLDNATVLIACKGNNAVRVAPAAGGGALTTKYGSTSEAGFTNGVGSAARMDGPVGMVTARSLSTVFVVNKGSCVRTIDLLTDFVGHLVGVCTSTGVTHDGLFNAARFDGATALAMGKGDDVLYISEIGNSAIRRLDLLSKTTKIVAGKFGTAISTDGPMGTSRVNTPACLVSDHRTGMVYGCTGHRLVALGSGHHVALYAGTPLKNLASSGGPGTGSFVGLRGIDCDVESSVCFAATMANKIASISETGVVGYVAGTGSASNADGNGNVAGIGSPIDVMMDTTQRLLYIGSGPALRTMGCVAPYVVTTVGGHLSATGAVDGAFGTHRVEEFHQMSTGPDVDRIYFTDKGNHVVRSISKFTKSVTTVAGELTTAATVDGAASDARFNLPVSIGHRRKTNVLYIGDSNAHIVRTIDMNTMMVATVLGTAGANGYKDLPGTDFMMDTPGQIRFTPDESTLLFTDVAGGCIRVIDADTLTPRDPIGLPGYVGWIPGEVDRPTVPRQAMTQGQHMSLLNGPAEVARVASAWSMPRTYPAGFEGLLLGDRHTGAVLRYTGADINALREGSTFIDRPATSEQWFYSRIVGETSSSCSGHATNNGALGTRFDLNFGLAVDHVGNAIYTGDSDRYIIRRVDLRTLISTTIAGTQIYGQNDGPKATARFGVTKRYIMDDARRRLYLLEDLLFGVRQIKVDELTTSTAITLFSGTRGVSGTTDGGIGTGRHMETHGLCFDGFRGWSKYLFIVEAACTVRRLDGATNVLSTVAGTPSSCAVVDGIGAAARFQDPRGIAVAATRGLAFIVEPSSHCLRQMSLSTFEVASVFCTAGGASGTFPGTHLRGPAQVIVSRDDTSLYVLEQGGNTIRRVDLNTLDSELIAGTYGEQTVGWDNGVPGVSRLRAARDFDQDPVTGYIWVADTGICSIGVLTNGSTARHVSGDMNIANPAAGQAEGSKTTARYTDLGGGAYDPVENVAYVGSQHRVDRVDMATGEKQAFAGTTSGATSSAPLLNAPRLTTTFGKCIGLHVDVLERHLYIAYHHSGAGTVRSIYRSALPGGAHLELMAGTNGAGFVGGQPGVSRWNHPTNFETVEGDGLLYVTDKHNNVVRTVDKTTKESSLAVVGCGLAKSNDGTLTSGCLNNPTGIRYSRKRQGFYVADRQSSAVRFFSLQEDYLTTVAGRGVVENRRIGEGRFLEAAFREVSDVALAPSEDELYIVSYPHEIARMDLNTGHVSHFLGDNSAALPRYEGPASICRLRAYNIFVGPPEELVVMDYYAVRKVHHFTSDHWVSSGDSAYAVTSLVGPKFGQDAVRDSTSGVVSVGAHSALYVTLPQRSVVLKVNLLTHEATEVWGRSLFYADNEEINGPTASDVTFARPSAIEHDSETGTLYVAEYTAGRIRATVLDSAGLPSTTTTVTAGLMHPAGIALGQLASGGPTVLFVADDANHVIQTVDVSTGVVTTIAGAAGTSGYKNGPSSGSLFSYPTGAAFHRPTTSLFIADKGNHLIRRIMLANTSVSTVAGVPHTPGHIDGGLGLARFHHPFGVAFGCAKSAVVGTTELLLYVTDASGRGVRAVSLTTGTVKTIAGRLGFRSSFVDGNGTAARFGTLQGIAAHSCRCDVVYAADATFGRVAEISLNGMGVFLGNATLQGHPPNGRSGQDAALSDPRGASYDRDGDRLFVASRGFNVVYSVAISSRAPMVVAGALLSSGTANGPVGTSRLQSPGHLLHVHTMDSLFISDEGARTVRQLRLVNHFLSTLAGAPGVATPVDGTGALAKFNFPSGIARSYHDHKLLVGDFNAGAIRRIDTNTKVVTTVAGQLNVPGSVDGLAASSKLTQPNGMARHRSTSVVYIACGDDVVRTLDERQGTDYLSTLIGTVGSHGDTDGGFSAALLDHPKDVVLAGDAGDGDTLLYIASGVKIRRAYLDLEKVDTAFGTNVGAGTRHGVFGKTGTVQSLAANGEALFVAHSAGEIASLRPELPPPVEEKAASTAASLESDLSGDVVGRTFGIFDKRGDYTVALVAGEPETPAITDGGALTTGRIHTPSGAAIHEKQNVMYVASSGQHCLIAVDLALHTMSLFSGTAGTSGTTVGPAASAKWEAPADIIFKPSEGSDPATMYVASAGTNTIRAVGMTAPFTVSTIAGSGVAGTSDAAGITATINYPTGIAFVIPSTTETELFIVARAGHNVRKMVLTGTMVSTVAGSVVVDAGHVDGVGSDARFNDPVGVRYRKSTAMLYVTCRGALRRLDPATEAVTTIGGSGYNGVPTFGPIETSTFGLLLFATFDPNNDALLYTTEFDGEAIGVVNLDSGTRSVIAGTAGARDRHAFDGPANRTIVAKPWGVVVHPSTQEIYFTSNGGAYIGKAFRPRSSKLTSRTVGGDPSHNDAVFDADALKVNMEYPMGTVYDARRRVLHIADHANCRLHSYRRETGQVRLLAGTRTSVCDHHSFTDGPAATVTLGKVIFLVYSLTLDTLFWTEYRRVARLRFGTMVTDTLAGKSSTTGHVDGPVGTSTFTRAVPIALTRDATTMYTGDKQLHSLRVIDMTAAGTPITTLVGTAAGHADGPQATAKIDSPSGFALRHTTGILYIATRKGTVRSYDPMRKTVSTLAGVFGQDTATVPGRVDNGGPARLFGTYNAAFSYDEQTLFVTGAQVMRIDMQSMMLSYDLGHPTQARCGQGAGVTAGQKYAYGITLAETSMFLTGNTCGILQQVDAVDLGAHSAAALTTTVATVAGNISRSGTADSETANGTRLAEARGIAVDEARAVAYVSDKSSIRLLSLIQYSIETLIGAPGLEVSTASCSSTSSLTVTLQQPAGLLLGRLARSLYIADAGAHRVFNANVSVHASVKLAVHAGDGTPGSADHATGPAAQFNGPVALAWTLDAVPALLVADEFSHTVRSVAAASQHGVTTIAGRAGDRGYSDGTGMSAEFDRPAGVAVLQLTRMGPSGAAFVSCRGSHTIRRIDLSTSAVTTVIGRPYSAGVGSGTAVVAVFFSPASLTADAQGTGLYVSDGGSRSVKHVFVDNSLGPVESTAFAGYPSSLSDDVDPPCDGARGAALFTNSIGQVVLLKGATSKESTEAAMLVADGGTIRAAFGAAVSVATVAGTRYHDRDKHATPFDTPSGVAHDPRDDVLFVSNAKTLVTVNLRTGVTSTLAGHPTEAANVQATGTAARFTHLAQLVYDSVTTTLYGCDAGAHNVRAVDPTTGSVSCYAGPATGDGVSGTTDGALLAARFHAPVGLTFGATTNDIIVCDRDNHVIRLISGGTVSRLSGAFGAEAIVDGPQSTARYSKPFGIVRRASTGAYYITCSGGHVIREMDPGTFAVRRIAGTGTAGTVDGVGTAAQFSAPAALAVSPDQRYLYVLSSNGGDGAMRQVDLEDSSLTVTTVAGHAGASTVVDGPLTHARFGAVAQMTVDPTGGFFMASSNDNTVKRISGLQGFGRAENTTAVTTVAGHLGLPGFKNSVGRTALLNTPSGIAVSTKRNAVFFTETTTCLVRTMSLDTYAVSVVAGQKDTCGSLSGAVLSSTFGQPTDVTIDDDGDALFVAEQSASIRRVDLAASTVAPFAGTHTPGISDGVGGLMGQPSGMQLDAGRTLLFFCDTTNHRIRSAAVANGALATLAGSAAKGFVDGVGSAANMNEPRGLTSRPGSSLLYFADRYSHAVRTFDPATNVVATLIGWGHEAGVGAGAVLSKPGLWQPTGIAFTDDTTMFVSSAQADAVWRIDLYPNGEVTVIGSGPRRGQTSAVDALDSAASFREPSALAADRRSGELYVGDSASHTIRRLYRTNTADGYVTSDTGSGPAPPELYQPTRAVRLVESVVSGSSSDKAETILVVEPSAGLIRRVWPQQRRVSEFIGKRVSYGGTTVGQALDVDLATPAGLVIDDTARVLYIASMGGGLIFKYDFSTEDVSSIFGDGNSHVDGDQDTARVNEPDGIELSADKTTLFIASRGSHVVRATTLATATTATPYGTVGTAGTAPGTGIAAQFNTPSDVRLHRRTSTLFVVSTAVSVISKIDLATGAVAPIAGVSGSTSAVDGAAGAGRMHHPTYVAFGLRAGVDDDLLYVSEESSHLLRRMSLAGTLTTVVGDVDSTHAAHIDGVPLHSRVRRIGQPAPMASGAVFFPDADAGTLRVLQYDTCFTTPTVTIAPTLTQTAAKTQTTTQTLASTGTVSLTLPHLPEGQLLLDGASTPGWADHGAPWVYPTSKPWRSRDGQFQPDPSGGALGRVYLDTSSYTAVVNAAREDGATAFHAVMALSFAAPTRMPLLDPSVTIRVACFATQSDATSWTSPLSTSAAVFKAWDTHADARRQRSGAVRYPLSSDCRVLAAEVELVGFAAVTNADLRISRGVVPDDVFTRLVASRPWVDPTTADPVESLAAAVPAPFNLGTDTAIPGGSGFTAVPALAPGYADGTNVFQCGSAAASITKVVALDSDSVAAVANGSLRMTAGALVSAVGPATSIEITANPSGFVLVTEIPAFGSAVDGHLSWVGVPDAPLPPGTTSVVVAFKATPASGSICSVFDALLLGLRVELSDRLDHTTDIVAHSTPPASSVVPDGGAEGPSNTMWPEESKWVVADSGSNGGRQRPLWVRGGRFPGSDGSRSFVVPSEPTVIAGRGSSKDNSDASITYGGSDAAGNVTIDVTPYGEASDRGLLDFQLSFVFAAPASGVSTMYPSDLPPADQSVVDAMKIRVNLTAVGLGWDGAAAVLPDTSLRPSAGSYGRRFRVTGRLPRLARALTLTLVICRGCAVDDVALFLKARSSAAIVFALPPIAEVTDAAALNSDFDGTATTSWTATVGAVTTASTTDVSVFPSAGGVVYPSARSVAVAYAEGPSVFSVCGAGATMEQSVSVPAPMFVGVDARRGYVHVSLRLVSAASSLLAVRVEARGCAAPPLGTGPQCGGHIVAEASFLSDPHPSTAVGTSASITALGGTVSPAVVELEALAAFIPPTTRSLRIVVAAAATSGPSDCALFDDVKVGLASTAERTVTSTVRVGRVRLAKMQALFYATLHARFVAPNPGGDFRTRYTTDEAYRLQVQSAVLQEISTATGIDPAALWVGPRWPLLPA